jgi:hypothetical protein
MQNAEFKKLAEKKYARKFLLFEFMNYNFSLEPLNP